MQPNDSGGMDLDHDVWLGRPYGLGGVPMIRLLFSFVYIVKISLIYSSLIIKEPLQSSIKLRTRDKETPTLR